MVAIINVQTSGGQLVDVDLLRHHQADMMLLDAANDDGRLHQLPCSDGGGCLGDGHYNWEGRGLTPPMCGSGATGG